MGWTLAPDEQWQWHWSVYNSAYGAAVGTSPTLADASVAMLIAERALFEDPFSEPLRAEMRSHPEHYTQVRVTDPIGSYLSEWAD
jgi:hypothetical protein